MYKDTLPSVIEYMVIHKVLPMDWVQGDLPRALAWRPQIARSPIQKFNKLPSFCSKKVYKSSISSPDAVEPVSSKQQQLEQKLSLPNAEPINRRLLGLSDQGSKPLNS